ncbi:MAG: hypothetical protein NWE89_03515 [Candidatus Bathyarchaeota archaeon]|nr:hypothetical protein [Candidatus Bathyarchaeota archaeon]
MGEVGVARLLSMFQGYPWLVIKIGILEKVLSDEDYFKIGDNYERENRLLKEMIKLEIMVTTVHFAEVFAANLLSLSRYEKTYHKKLLEYNTGEIKDFYDSINVKSNDYVAKLLCYPDLDQLDSVMLNEVVESCNLVKNFLTEIGKYYLDNLQIYNSYKHGFRIGIAEGSNENGTNPRMQLIYPMSTKNLAEVTIRLGLEIKKESSYCFKMYDILNNVVKTFSQRFLDEKSEFNVTVWRLRE